MQNTQAKIEKTKFKRCEQKLIFFDTFIRNGQIYYALQCQSKDFFVGLANSKFDLTSIGSVPDRINCIAFSKATDSLYMGSTKGHIHCWNLETTEQKQWKKIQSIHGKAYLALLIFKGEDEAEEIIAFSTDGKCLYFKNFVRVHEKTFFSPIRKIETAKDIEDENDICMVIVFASPEFPFPHVFDLIWVQKFLLSPLENSLETGMQLYQKSMSYQADELSKMCVQPVAISLSNSAAILVLAQQNAVTVFTIDKKDDNFYLECDLKIEEEEILDINITETNLLILTQKSIICFNLEKRKKIAKNMTLKGAQTYTSIKWAKFGKEILFANLQFASMKLFHCSLNLI